MKRIKKVVSFIFSGLFFYSPFFALLFIAFNFLNEGLIKSLGDKYKILFGAIGFTAMLSGLSLRASSSTEDKDKKSVFYTAGERLFHSSILFIVSAVLQYAIERIDLLSKNSSSVLITKIILSIPTFLFFFFGIIYSYIALTSLHKTLFKGWEKPLD